MVNADYGTVKNLLLDLRYNYLSNLGKYNTWSETLQDETRATRNNFNDYSRTLFGLCETLTSQPSSMSVCFVLTFKDCFLRSLATVKTRETNSGDVSRRKRDAIFAT